MRGFWRNPAALCVCSVSRRERGFEAALLSLVANPNESDHLASHARRNAYSLESGDLGIRDLFHLNFTYNNLTGRKSLFSSDTGSRQALPRLSQLRRQIYFAYNILIGRKSLFPSDIGSCQALQFVCGVSAAKFISPITF